MKYQQPYGVSDPNAAYVNGNPTTGTMGSIPPAASIEFDQREIVEVIGRANSRGYKDFSDTACAAPADGDLQQLRKAIEGFVRALPIQFSDLIDSFVTFTVHGTSPNFPTLFEALEYLSKYKITQHGRVILQLRGTVGAGAATIYTYNQRVVFDHPQNHRIFLMGATMRAPLPNSSTGYTLTGTTAGARASDTAANLAMLRTKFATELRFVNGSGIEVVGHQLGSMNALLITSDGSISSDGLFSSSGINITGPSTQINQANLWDATIPTKPTDGVAVVGFAQHGIYVGQGGNLTAFGMAYPIVSLGNGADGFQCNAQSKLQPIGRVLSYSNGGSGFRIQVGSTLWFDVTGCESAYNASDGVAVDFGAFGMVASAKIWGNANYGITAAGRSYCNATLVNFSSGGVFSAVGDAWANDGSQIWIGSSTGHRSLWSPALATVGNNQSYIHV